VTDQGRENRRHDTGSSSSTDTDEDFNSVFFPSSSASSTPGRTLLAAATAQAPPHQQLLSAHYFTPVRSAKDSPAVRADDGLSTPVHSWISCAQQFIGFGGNSQSRGWNTNNIDSDDDESQSLTRFLFSPVDDSICDSDTVGSVLPMCGSLPAVGSSSCSSSFVQTVPSPIAAPIISPVAGSGGGMATDGTADISHEHAVPSTPFISSGSDAPGLGFSCSTTTLAAANPASQSERLVENDSPPPAAQQSTVYSILSRYLAECPASPWVSPPSLPLPTPPPLPAAAAAAAATERAPAASADPEGKLNRLPSTGILEYRYSTYGMFKNRTDLKNFLHVYNSNSLWFVMYRYLSVLLFRRIRTPLSVLDPKRTELLQ